MVPDPSMIRRQTDREVSGDLARESDWRQIGCKRMSLCKRMPAGRRPRRRSGGRFIRILMEAYCLIIMLPPPRVPLMVMPPERTIEIVSLPCPLP